MIKRCSKGHWYDASVNRMCPHCRQESEKLGIRLNDIEEDDHTISITEVNASLGKELDAVLGKITRTQTESVVQGMEPDDDKTISFGFFGMREMPPVTGWLVCTTGSERGRDYRLHAGKNFIGRSPSMDITPADDKKISREKHCAVIYDPKGNVFYVSAENGNLVYHNQKLLESAALLEENDTITVGDTSFIFIPFSKGERKWENESKDL